jgi:hypothetical protein
LVTIYPYGPPPAASLESDEALGFEPDGCEEPEPWDEPEEFEEPDPLDFELSTDPT